MLIQYQSDLHLEFDSEYRPPIKGDILILAGDILVADYFRRSEASPYHETANRFRSFLKHVSSGFKRVIMIMGNHEHYHGDINETYYKIRIETNAFPNIEFMEDSFIEIGDTRFIGSTLWTNFNQGCPITENTVREGMNDYRIIKNRTRKLIPLDTRYIHNRSLGFIESALDHPKVVVVTHHAPSPQSIVERFKDDYFINGAYFSNLESFILKYPQIKFWVHGHMHSSLDYMIGDTKVICNPKGYNGENPEFNPEATFII